MPSTYPSSTSCVNLLERASHKEIRESLSSVEWAQWVTTTSTKWAEEFVNLGISKSLYKWGRDVMYQTMGLNSLPQSKIKPCLRQNRRKKKNNHQSLKSSTCTGGNSSYVSLILVYCALNFLWDLIPNKVYVIVGYNIYASAKYVWFPPLTKGSYIIWCFPTAMSSIYSTE